MTKAGYYRESESREFDSEMANPTRYSQESREIMKFGKSGFPTPEFVPIVTGLKMKSL